MCERYEIALGSQAEFEMLQHVKRNLSLPIALAAAPSTPWWLWPNLLSLDAPLLALVWQEAFARAFTVELSWTHRALLALGVWLAYSGDRLLDARRLPTVPVDSARHEFARAHGRPLKLAWLSGLAVLVGLGLQQPDWVILAGVGLLTVVGVYFLLHHWQWTRGAAGVMKELMAGSIFATGALFFIGLQTEWTLALLAGVLAWAGLCGVNCLCIARWDRILDTVMEQGSLTRRWAGLDRALPGLVAAVALMAGLAVQADDRLAEPMAAVVLGLAGLLALDRRPWSDEARRVLADAVLLGPVFFWGQ